MPESSIQVKEDQVHIKKVTYLDVPDEDNDADSTSDQGNIPAEDGLV